MKKGFLLALALLSVCGFSQEKFSNYYYQKVSMFEELTISAEDIVFLGDSITEGGEWNEIFPDLRVKNRGISGDTTAGLISRLPSLLKAHPKQIFLMIGVNDIVFEKSDTKIVDRIAAIVAAVQKESPETELFLQSLLPMNPSFPPHKPRTRQWQRIDAINRMLQKVAADAGIRYIDLYSHFTDEKGHLKKELTNDGLHLLGAGYRIWQAQIETLIRL